MFELLGVPQALGQLLLGLINGAFYAMLSLGLAVIFGMLNVINFAHGAVHDGRIRDLDAAQLPRRPLLGGACAGPAHRCAWNVIERLFLSRLYHLDHLYGLLLTFGLALIIEGVFRQRFGISLPYANPLPGGVNLGFMFLPWYRVGGRVLADGLPLTWFMIEKTKLGSYLRRRPSGPTSCRRSASTCRA